MNVKVTMLDSLCITEFLDKGWMKNSINGKVKKVRNSLEGRMTRNFRQCW